MWEYRHAIIRADSLETALANWVTRDGWEYVDRLPYHDLGDMEIRYSVLFRRQVGATPDRPKYIAHKAIIK